MVLVVCDGREKYDELCFGISPTLNFLGVGGIAGDGRRSSSKVIIDKSQAEEEGLPQR